MDEDEQQVGEEEDQGVEEEEDQGVEDSYQTTAYVDGTMEEGGPKLEDSYKAREDDYRKKEDSYQSGGLAQDEDARKSFLVQQV